MFNLSIVWVRDRETVDRVSNSRWQGAAEGGTLLCNISLLLGQLTTAGGGRPDQSRASFHSKPLFSLLLRSSTWSLSHHHHHHQRRLNYQSPSSSESESITA